MHRALLRNFVGCELMLRSVWIAHLWLVKRAYRLRPGRNLWKCVEKLTHLTCSVSERKFLGYVGAAD